MRSDNHRKNRTEEVPGSCMRVKSLRKLMGMSQKDFSAAIGLSQGHLCSIEKGVQVPSDTLIMALCHRHKVNEDWLLTGEGDMFAAAVTGQGIPVFNQPPENYPEDACGMDMLGYLCLPDLPKEGFALYQRGDYMTPTIQAHDLVIFESACSINNEDLVLVKNKWGTWLIRRFRKANDKVMLTADNPAYRAFEYDPDEQKILAKVSSVMRNVNF